MDNSLIVIRSDYMLKASKPRSLNQVIIKMQVNIRTHFMEQAMFASIDNYHKITKYKIKRRADILQQAA